LFAEIEADVYIMVDGDDTYDAKSAPAMINEVMEVGIDMVVGRVFRRRHGYRFGHEFGNRCHIVRGNSIGADSPIFFPDIA